MGSADVVIKDNIKGVFDTIGDNDIIRDTTGGIEGEGYFARGATGKSQCTREQDMGAVLILNYLEL